MTREEFMEHARDEIDRAFSNQKNRMMNLVEQAWAEGKRNAEAEQVQEIGTDIFEMLKEKLVGPATIPIEWPNSNDVPWQVPYTDYIPDGCKHCRNHPSNGGSGICHCIIGTQKITC